VQKRDILETIDELETFSDASRSSILPLMEIPQKRLLHHFGTAAGEGLNKRRGEL
jgi:hypothetical protein